jgi:hypothetical protein
MVTGGVWDQGLGVCFQGSGLLGLRVCKCPLSCCWQPWPGAQVGCPVGSYCQRFYIPGPAIGRHI